MLCLFEYNYMSIVVFFFLEPNKHRCLSREPVITWQNAVTQISISEPGITWHYAVTQINISEPVIAWQHFRTDGFGCDLKSDRSHSGVLRRFHLFWLFLMNFQLLLCSACGWQSQPVLDCLLLLFFCGKSLLECFWCVSFWSFLFRAEWTVRVMAASYWDIACPNCATSRSDAATGSTATITALDSCLAAEETSGRETITAAQGIRGLCRIYPSNRSARDKLLGIVKTAY